MNCYEKLNLWLSEDNPIYEDCKKLDYHYFDAKIVEGRDTFLRAPPTIEHFKNELKKTQLPPEITLWDKTFYPEEYGYIRNNNL